MLKLLPLAILAALPLFAQVPGAVTAVQSDPGGTCQTSYPMQRNLRTGQYWVCGTTGVWTKISPANLITTRTTDPTGAACDPKSIALRTPGGALYTCVSGVYAAAGGSLPVGSGNKVVATPADGSSGAGALRALVAGDYASPGGALLMAPRAGASLTGVGADNSTVAIGSDALGSATTAQNNVAIGNSAGYSNIGSGNVYLGYSTGYTGGTDTGNGNTFIGAEVANSSTGVTGSESVVIGFQAGIALAGGFNTIIGGEAGSALTGGTGNVFLGAHAGAAETGSNKLYIDNTNTATPLIGGDFMARTVALSGTVSIGTGAGAANTAVCWKAGGVLGWASNTMGVIGTTCN